MFPTVFQLTRLDVYRDGGSVSASFKDANGSEFTLFFGIDSISRQESHIAISSYRDPILEQYTRIPRTSPVTGLVSIDWEKEVQPVSWEDADCLLQQIAPMMDGFVSDYLWVFDEMCRAVCNKGRAGVVNDTPKKHNKRLNC